MAVYEGRWDCPRCGLQGNRGSARACGGCSAPRGTDSPVARADAADEPVTRVTRPGPTGGPPT